ncbi:unnamed protein product [Effrenium voratum]|nr:unnamed protein product [Effrenium voratum]
MARIEGVWPKAVEEVLGRDISEQILEWSVVAHGDGLAHAEKHEAQNLALAEMMLKDRQLSSASQVVVEFGSGKGGLAAAVLRLRSARCVLVEREPRRHKFENKQDAREKQVLRLRLDIADFDLGTFLGSKLGGGLPKAADLSGGALSVSAGTNGPAERLEELWRSAAAFQEAGPWPPSSLAACAKHLCGGATDVALRSLQACPRGQGLSVCVATCCHHRCDPDSYVNRRFLERLGLCDSAEDFRQFVSTAGWAVGGERDLQKKRVGMMSKRILDLGRVAWLREELGLEAAIREYISKAVTPENVVITGRRADAFKASRPARTLLRCLPWCC